MGTNTYPWLYSPFLFCGIDYSGGCQYSQDVRVQVPVKKYLHGSRRMAPWILLPRIPLFFDTLRPRDREGSEGVAALGSCFLPTILGLVTGPAFVSLQTLAFFFPLVASTFSSFNAD